MVESMKCSEFADSAGKLSIKSLNLPVHKMLVLAVIRPNKLKTKWSFDRVIVRRNGHSTKRVYC